MFTIGLITFREFLEAFLILGLFLGISKKTNLKKEVEIVSAVVIGILLSLLLSSSMYVFSNYARGILTEKNADSLESYLLIFSGTFLVYVVFSVHKVLHRSSHAILKKTQEKIEQKIFDISLFFTIVFLILREGFEVALFTASSSLFFNFTQNITGLLLGFLGAGFVGLATSLIYLKVPLKKVFRTTEYLVILLGASLFQNGITKLFYTHFNIYLSKMMSFHLGFLPKEDSILGTFLQNFIGVDREFSLIRLFVMVTYVFCVYLMFIKQTQEVKI